MKAFPTARPKTYEDDTWTPTLPAVEHTPQKPHFLKQYDPIAWHKSCAKWHERRCWYFEGEEFKYHYLAYRWHLQRLQSLTP